MCVGTKRFVGLKEFSFRLRKTNVGWKNNLSVGKKNVGGRISPAIPRNVRIFPGMQDRKRAEAGKNPLGPIGGEKRLSFGKQKFLVGWERELLVGGKNVG